MRSRNGPEYVHISYSFNNNMTIYCIIYYSTFFNIQVTCHWHLVMSLKRCDVEIEEHHGPFGFGLGTAGILEPILGDVRDLLLGSLWLTSAQTGAPDVRAGKATGNATDRKPDKRNLAT